MLGWQDLPSKLDRDYLQGITKAAEDLAGRVDAYVSLGIGGSYLGIEATIRALKHNYANQLPPRGEVLSRGVLSGPEPGPGFS